MRKPSSPTWLPTSICAVFCAATLWLLLGEFPEAWNEHRRARRALAEQMAIFDQVCAERGELALRCLSLDEDPQERERILDELFLLPRVAEAADER
jgi:hypothetical protein